MNYTMRHIKQILYPVFALLLCCACDNEDLGESLIDTSTPILNETDTWIRQNYTTPFNVEVKYRWDNSELDNTKILTPPYEKDVVPFLEQMKNIWIEPYLRQGGETFIKTYIPKLIVLVGSHNLQSDGSIVLGQAEGGRKVTIFDLNYISFDFEGLSDYEKEKQLETIIRTFQTMHHEFAHILHQTVAYPVEFKKITPNYIRNWMNYTTTEAKRMGFITSYSMLNPNEDFAEMVSQMLTTSREQWDKTIDNIVVYDDNYDVDVVATATAKANLREKEKMIADYMTNTWNIDIYALQADIMEAINNLTKTSNE